MRITDFEWDEENIDHIARHRVEYEEVEEACYNRPFILRGRGGLHLIHGRTDNGRYLFVVVRYRGKETARVITARDMTDAEKRLCRERRG